MYLHLYSLDSAECKGENHSSCRFFTTMIISFSSSPWILLLLAASLLTWLPICISDATLPTMKAVDIGTPFLEFSPSPLTKQSPIKKRKKDVLFCDRIGVLGRSRLELGSYPNSFRVTLAPSFTIPENLHGKILICSHKNASLGLCQCDQNDWRSVKKGEWSSEMSPYDVVYIDVKVTGKVPGSISISVGEELHLWRACCLAIGSFFLLLAPICSSWAPMFIDILLLILFVLYQVLKLLPSMKNIFDPFWLGPMRGVVDLMGSFPHTLGMMSQGMHHLGLGERIFLILEDGTVAIVVVKWAMRIIAVILYSQSTLDRPLAVMAFFASSAICFLISKWKDATESARSIGATANRYLAEFPSRSLRNG